jgi:hypothetical protein
MKDLTIILLTLQDSSRITCPPGKITITVMLQFIDAEKQIDGEVLEAVLKTSRAQVEQGLQSAGLAACKACSLQGASNTVIPSAAVFKQLLSAGSSRNRRWNVAPVAYGGWAGRRVGKGSQRRRRLGVVAGNSPVGRRYLGNPEASFPL